MVQLTADNKLDSEAEPLPCSLRDEQKIRDLHFKDENNLNELDFNSFSWHINDLSDLKEKEYSPGFFMGDIFWRILLFPKGNSQERSSISIYMDNLNVKDQEEIDLINSDVVKKDHICAKFVIFLSKPTDDFKYMFKVAHHRFNKDESDWGFTSFSDYQSLLSMIKSDGQDSELSLKITAYIQILEDPTGVLWHNFINYDSKKITGYVGLKNQGATCYMNSLLQTLYFVKSFRKAVYQIPTTNNTTNKIPLSLQKLFYRLKTSKDYVDTSELIKSFGWDTAEAFMQHDVQEFNKILIDNIEISMKNTEVEKSIQNLFCGKMKSFIKCLNVEYESSRVEEFSDIQLNVKGFENIAESLVDYCKTEMLDGDNKYMAGSYGLQDAQKGVVFEDLPPVLQLHLMRYAYDFETDTMIKINDRFEYPEILDFRDYLSNKEGAQNTQYVLHGVLVHSGDINSGHYYALIRPELEERWFKFDDEKVIPVTNKEVYDDNFGGSSMIKTASRSYNKRRSDFSTNAYMLVYYSKAHLAEILADDYEIPKHILELPDDQTHTMENNPKELENITYYITTTKDFKKNVGIDLVDIEHINQTCNVKIDILRSTKLSELVAKISSAVELSTDKIKLWSYTKRPNFTIRPDNQVDFEKYKDSMAIEFGEVDSRFILFVEQMNPVDTKKGFFRETTIMLFLKYYDEEKNELEFINSFYVSLSNKISKYSSDFMRACGLNEDSLIDLYEESGHGLGTVKKLTNESFKVNDLSNGDVVILCKQSNGNIENIKSFYKELTYMCNITFVNIDAQNSSLMIKLDKRNDYNTMAKSLASQISENPNKIQFTMSNTLNKQPGDIIKASENHSIAKILEMQKSHVIYYQAIDMDISQLENMIDVDIVWSRSLNSEKHINTSILRDATVEQLVEILRRENLNDKSHLEILYNDHSFLFGSKKYKHYKIFNQNDLVDEFNNCDMIHIENLEINIREIPNQDLAVFPVFHYVNKLYPAGLSPFFIVIERKDTNKDITAKIIKRFGLSDKYCSSLVLGVEIEDDVRQFEEEDNWCEIIFNNKQFIKSIAIQHPKKIKKPNDGAIRFK